MQFFLLLLELYARFFSVGLFSVGGGLATLPFLQAMGETTGWFGAAEISNMVAISESTPGPLGINMATYVGFHVAGAAGSVLAPIGLITPSIVVIIIISKILIKFRDSKYVNDAFYGLRAASLGLVTAACWAVARIAFFRSEVFSQTGNFISAIDYKSIILAVVIFVLLKCFKKVHPIVWILVAAAVGVVLKMGG